MFQKAYSFVGTLLLAGAAVLLMPGLSQAQRGGGHGRGGGRVPQGMTVRQSPRNTPMMGQTFMQPRRFSSNPFMGTRFDRFEDRFERRSSFGRFDRFEDRFERRFGVDPFLGNPFGVNPFSRRRFGVDPFLGSPFGFNSFLGSPFSINPFFVP
jgi:hypothetical protein